MAVNDSLRPGCIDQAQHGEQPLALKGGQKLDKVPARMSQPLLYALDDFVPGKLSSIYVVPYTEALTTEN
jgi:hypothetical protein